ncbi:alpha/beta hydrolase [Croceibacterium ferulae]|uniref:alpha/beta hydrolase n=1 Tax=Croceibacterium ferulae TaxID=1854641 RepID=UPI0013905EF7|nr:alpha/beta hydrolase-fold protein [Croceibacterium ferulae]
MIVKNEITVPDDCYRLPGATSWIAGDYRIDLLVPDGPAPAAGWPAVWLLDGASCFGTCAEAMRRMSRRSDATGVVPQVVVGISAADGDRARRQTMFTTPRDDRPDAGGAGGFLRFLLEEVRPAVAARVSVDESRATLLGHSLAGYFTLWVLATAPAAFRTYAAISPSTWWDRPLLDEALARASGDRRVLVCIGEWEDALPPWQARAPGAAEALARRQARQMVTGAREIAALLAGVLGEERVQFRLLPEEDHASILSAAIPRMLRMASVS